MTTTSGATAGGDVLRGAVPTADALARVGLFVRGGSDVSYRLAEYDRKLGSIVSELQRVNYNLTMID